MCPTPLLNIRSRTLIYTIFLSFSQISYLWSIHTLQESKYFFLSNITQNFPIVLDVNYGLQHSFFWLSKNVFDSLRIQVLKILILVTNCVPLAPSISFLSILFSLWKSPVLSEESFHIFSTLLLLFPVYSDFNIILLISDITDLILPPYVIYIASLNSFGTWENSENMVSYFLKDNCLFGCLFISTNVCVGINGDVWVIFGHFLFYHFSFYYTAWVHICSTAVKWWYCEIMICWSGYMVGL